MMSPLQLLKATEETACEIADPTSVCLVGLGYHYRE